MMFFNDLWNTRFSGNKNTFRRGILSPGFSMGVYHPGALTSETNENEQDGLTKNEVDQFNGSLSRLYSLVRISMPQRVGDKVHVIIRDHRVFDNATVIGDDGLDLTILVIENDGPQYIKINWREVWNLYDQAQWELENELAQSRQVEEEGEDDDR